MDEKSNYNKIIFKYDLDAYGIAIKDKDFKQANIFANRIMSNASLLDDMNYGIFGYVLKEVASDGITISFSKDDKMILDFSQKSSKVVGVIIKMYELDNIRLDELWSAYSDHQKATHTMFMTKQEKNAYIKSDTEFSNTVLQKLMSFLENNINILFERRNMLFRGILNEIGRLSKVHGLSGDDERFVSLLRMLERIDGYIKQTTDKNDFPKKSEETINLTTNVIRIFNSGADSEKCKQIDTSLWEMIKIWRNYFIQYMEIGSSFAVRQERQSEDVENELVEEVTKHIEQNLGV